MTKLVHTLRLDDENYHFICELSKQYDFRTLNDVIACLIDSFMEVDMQVNGPFHKIVDN